MVKKSRSTREIKPEVETFAKIKVMGIGGSGGSAINRMINDRIRGVEFVSINTDAQALSTSRASNKVQIGVETTGGLGAGMDVDTGARSAEENIEDIEKVITGSDMIFITYGLGGGTGTGAGPIIADIARNQGALTVAVVTKPFSFEGAQRKAIAEKGLDDLESRVDTIITIPNDRILSIIDRKTSLLESFKTVDEVLHQGIQGISEIITVPGLVNVDFADVKAIMVDTGSALMGIGKASGEDRAKKAAKEAIDSPLLDVSIAGAKGILFTVTGGEDLTMFEVNEIAEIITASADGNAKIIFGTVIDESMKGEIKVMVIATGFESFEISTKNLNKSKASDITYTPSPHIGKAKKLEEDTSKDDIDFDIEEKVEVVENNMESELDIPAFIRRKMK